MSKAIWLHFYITHIRNSIQSHDLCMIWPQNREYVPHYKKHNVIYSSSCLCSGDWCWLVVVVAAILNSFLYFSLSSIRYFAINMFQCSWRLCLISLSNIGVWLVRITKSLIMRYDHLISRESRAHLSHPCYRLSAVHIKSSRTGTQTRDKRFQVERLNAVDNNIESVMSWDDDAFY